MKFNKEQANKAGESNAVGTGKHAGQLTAKKIVGQHGAQGIEFTLWTGKDRSINYLRVYYVRNDGSESKFGANIIQALMGICRLDEINIENLPHDAAINEFHGKQVGLLLQKVIYSKTDGSDGWKFEIKAPFIAQTGQTYKEATEKKPATFIDSMLETLEDKDERKPQEQSGQYGYGQPQYDTVPDDYDDAPF